MARAGLSLKSVPVPPALFAVLAVLFLATVIRSALGFGEALVAVPLLALVIPVEVAAPVAVMVSVTVALVAVIQDWRKIHLRSAALLVISTMAGIPLGLWMLKAAPEHVVKLILAIVIMAFSLNWLLGREREELKHDRFAWLFGFSAGILGGAYGINGPPLAFYGSLRRWTPQHFRATLQGYFLPASLAGLWGYRLTGLWTPLVSRYFLLSLPCVFVAILLGRAINHRMKVHQFLRYVHCGLIVIGGILLAQAARHYF